MTRNILRALAILAVLTITSPAQIPPPPGGFTIVAIPDTQDIMASASVVFDLQMLWILNNRFTHDIAFVVHEGDVVDMDVPAEWANARDGFRLIDDRVPYAIATGNHDYVNNAQERRSHFNAPQFFGPGSRYTQQAGVGGFYEPTRTDNSWHTFTAQGRNWIVLALEWSPRDPVLAWADGVLNAHPNHVPIVVNHSYLYHDDTRYDWNLRFSAQLYSPHIYGTASSPEGVNDGQAMWEKLISRHDVAMVFSGHVLGDGNGRLASVTPTGHVVHQMVANYQNGVTGALFGGSGFMRLIQVDPDGQTVRVWTWSPVLGIYHPDPDQHFTIGLFNDPVTGDAEGTVAGDAPHLYWRLEDPATSATNQGIGGAALDPVRTGTSPHDSIFNGTNWIDSASPVAAAAQWSIAAWVRADQQGAQAVAGTERPGANDDIMIVNDALDRWAIVHEDDATQAVTVARSDTPTEALRWYHLVATCDGTHLNLWVDGQLAARTTALGADLDVSSAPFRVGRRNDTVNPMPFVGDVAEVAWFQHALTATEVTEHRLSSLGRVTAGRIRILDVADPDDDSPNTANVASSGAPGIGVAFSNEGDVALELGYERFDFRDGIVLANVAQNDVAGQVASVEVSANTFGDGNPTVSITEVGSSPAGPPNEVNHEVWVGFFPFRGGWTGAHVGADGTPGAGSGVEEHQVTHTGPGRYAVDLGVDIARDGMLLAGGLQDGDHVVTTSLDPDRGWRLRTMSNRMNAPGDKDAMFSFVYIPWDTEGLVAGRCDGATGLNRISTGRFQMVRTGVGRYTLTLPGRTPGRGGLLATPCVDGAEPPAATITWQENTGGSFDIRVRTVPGLVHTDISFVWAYVEGPFMGPAPLEGTGDDLELGVLINGTGSGTKPETFARVGDLVSIRLRSPAGTLGSAYPMLLMDGRPDGTPGPGSFPGHPATHLGPTPIPVYTPQIAPPGVATTLNPGPIQIDVLMPPGLTGLTLRFQGFGLTGMASNGFYAATDAIDVVFL